MWDFIWSLDTQGKGKDAQVKRSPNSKLRSKNRGLSLVVISTVRLLEDINSCRIPTPINLRSKVYDCFPSQRLSNNTSGFWGFGFILPFGHCGQ